MASPTKYRVVFKAEEVISAQRMRFLRSSKFRILTGLWAVASLWSLGATWLPGVIPPIPFVAPGVILGTAALFLLVVAAFYWLAPLAEYRNNTIWKTPFQMQMTEENLILNLDGRAKGVLIRWEQIRNVHENEQAYILYTRSEDNFLILPKSVFPDPGVERRFRGLLASRSSLKPRVKEKYSA